jgi:hypothetical protein
MQDHISPRRLRPLATLLKRKKEEGRLHAWTGLEKELLGHVP